MREWNLLRWGCFVNYLYSVREFRILTDREEIDEDSENYINMYSEEENEPIPNDTISENKINLEENREGTGLILTSVDPEIT